MARHIEKKTGKLLTERYLQGETTLEEERQLEEFLAENEDALSEDEQAVRWLLTAMPQTTVKEPSDEKAKAFDQLMGAKRLNPFMLWAASAVAAVVVAFLLWHEKPAGTPAPQMVARTEAVTPAPATPAVSSSEATPPQHQRAHPYNKRGTTSINAHSNNSPLPLEEAEEAPALTVEELGEELMAAVNFDLDQIDTYQLQPAGDATIVKKNSADGTSCTYIVAYMGDSEGYRLIPIEN